MAIGGQHTLRGSAGAGGEDDRLGMPGLDRQSRLRWRAGGFLDALEIEHAQALDRRGRRTDDDQGLELGAIHLRQPGRERAMGQDHPGIGNIDHMGQQLPPIGMIALSHAQVLQGGGQAAGARQRLGVVPPLAILKTNEAPIRLPRRPALQHHSQNAGRGLRHRR